MTGKDANAHLGPKTASFELITPKWFHKSVAWTRGIRKSVPSTERVDNHNLDLLQVDFQSISKKGESHDVSVIMCRK